MQPSHYNDDKAGAKNVKQEFGGQESGPIINENDADGEPKE